MTENKEFLTLSEAREKLGICESGLRRLIREQGLPVLRVSPRRIVIPVKQFAEWVEVRCNDDDR